MKSTELFVEQTLTGFLVLSAAVTLLERFNRWNRLLFAIELKEKNEGLSHRARNGGVRSRGDTLDGARDLLS